MPEPVYPDISDILARKEEARHERARLPYGQKILIVEKMRRELLTLLEAGRRRRAAQAAERG